MRLVHFNIWMQKCQILFDYFLNFLYNNRRNILNSGDGMKKLWIPLLILSLLLTGCGSKGPAERDFFAMDTMISLKVWGEKEALDEAEKKIRSLEQELSVTDKNSSVCRLNQTGTASLPAEISELLESAVSVSEMTGGAFDPTVYPFVKAWGFTSDQHRIPPEEELKELSAFVGTDHIHLDDTTVTLEKGAMLDLGGIAKGYAAQKCAELLKAHGTECAILSLGGNVQTVGNKPDGTQWAVGIADPKNPSASAAVLHFEGSKALVTSGSYQRYFEQDEKKYHHILNPKTGYPADNSLASVTILMDSGTLADGFSTALFVMGMEKATEFWRSRNDFEAVFIQTDGAVFATEGAAPLLSDCEFKVIAR